MITSFPKSARTALLLAGVAVTALITSGAASAQDESFNASQKEEIESVIQNYLMENPEIIADAMNELRAKQEREMQDQAKAKLEEYKDFFQTAEVPVAGNPEGDVTVVEFFDYNCGYCKKALPDVQALLEQDENVRVVLMDMPILGPSSLTASKFALAAKKQDKYFEYHTALMEFQGSKDEAALKKLATDIGLDAEKLAEDAQDPAIADMINENISIAQEIGIRGTPGFIVGDELYRGYIGEDALIQSVKDQ